jgi:uncharacterized protein with PIN domain
MKFETARRVTGLLIVMAVASIVLAYALFLEGDPMRDRMISVGAIFTALTAANVYFFCRCPYCGKVLFANLFRMKVCPKCNRDLATGSKMKGKKKR